jgi:hypothetical protein
MRRYLAWFALVVCAVLLPTVYLSYLFGPIDGDLTRTGGYSERDFGWNSTQPVIDVAPNGKINANPDALVLGDSFSGRNVWQSAFAARSGKAIQSFHYNQVGCIANWIDHALKHPTARLIIVEVIERELLKRFASMPGCKPTQPIPLEIQPGKTAPQRTTWPPEWHVYHAYRVALNTLEMQLKPHERIRSNLVAARSSVINAPLEPGCANFSNRRADRLLYLALDEDKQYWSHDDQARAIAHMSKLQQLVRARGKELVIVVVPDKLSVYWHCLQNKGTTGKARGFADALTVSGIDAPDLFKEFRLKSDSVVDLYYPNNTHLSVSGYVLMADTLWQFLSRKAPALDSGG